MPRARKTKELIEKVPKVELTKGEEPEPKSKLRLFLEDENKVALAESLAEAGFSVNSIASKLKISGTTFSHWIKTGQRLQEEAPEDDTVKLYQILAEKWSTARGLAELSLMQRNPELYLTRGPGALLGDDWQETKGTAVEEQAKLEVGTQFLEALKLLRKQGYDLNTIIDGDTMSLITATPKSLDYKEEASQAPKSFALPGELGKLSTTLDTTLDLKYGAKDASTQEN